MSLRNASFVSPLRKKISYFQPLRKKTWDNQTDSLPCIWKCVWWVFLVSLKAHHLNFQAASCLLFSCTTGVTNLRLTLYSALLPSCWVPWSSSSSVLTCFHEHDNDSLGSPFSFWCLRWLVASCLPLPLPKCWCSLSTDPLLFQAPWGVPSTPTALTTPYLVVTLRHILDVSEASAPHFKLP